MKERDNTLEELTEHLSEVTEQLEEVMQKLDHFEAEVLGKSGSHMSTVTIPAGHAEEPEHKFSNPEAGT